MRVSYHVWGSGATKLGLTDSYAMFRAMKPGLTDSDARLSSFSGSKLSAVLSSLERRTGLLCCAGPKDEGMELSHNRPVARHYCCTLGRPMRLNGRPDGYSVVAQVWFSILVES